MYNSKFCNLTDCVSLPCHCHTCLSLQNKVNVQVMQKQILPVSLFFAISLVLSNKAYIYLSVSYIQVPPLFFCS